MRAAVYRRRGELRIEQIPVREPGPQEVLVRVAYCGVCGTDLHLVMDGWGRPGSVGGHEYSGRVVAVGEGVTRWRPGDAVVGAPEPGCGRCEYCRAHRPGLCTALRPPGVEAPPGAFAEYRTLPAAELRAVPAGLSLRVAALAEPLAVALHGITRSGVRPGERALVTGAGPIGQLVVAALRARGVRDVVVSERSPLRRRLATELGARAVSPEELAAPVMPFQTVDAPFHAAFECSGAAAAAEAALAQLRKAGTLVLLGTGAERPRLDAQRVLLGELVVTGAFNYDADGFERALDLLTSDALPTDRLLHPSDVPLEALRGAMDDLVAARIAGKLLVAPHGGEEGSP